jgi:lysozyme
VKINQAGLDIVKEREGLRLEAYRDPVGIWTIGYGHTKTAKSGMVVTKEEAEALLRKDLEDAEEAVDIQVTVPLNPNQFSALVSFVYNVGSGNLQRSTLKKLLNQGKYEAAAKEFDRWVYAGGKKLNGLVTRRKMEKGLFLTPYREEISTEPNRVPLHLKKKLDQIILELENFADELEKY